jgi:hypothetical protein
VVSNSLAVPTMPIPGKWGLSLALVNKIMVVAAPRVTTRVKVGPTFELNACTGADDLLICPDNRTKLIARSGSPWIVVFADACAGASCTHQRIAAV